MAQAGEVKFGVHSEVGQLRKVMVCAPGLAHTRLTPSNCDQLLFDDVLWVDNAKRDHFDFVSKMRDRGIEVLEMHDLLAQTMAVPEGKKWVLDNQIVPNQVGLGFIDELRSYLEGLDNRKLAETLLGGLSTNDFPEEVGGKAFATVRDAAGAQPHESDLEHCFDPRTQTPSLASPSRRWRFVGALWERLQPRSSGCRTGIRSKSFAAESRSHKASLPRRFSRQRAVHATIPSTRP